MLLLRPRRHGAIGDKPGRLPVHRVRARKFGPVLHEQQLRRTQDIAIYGPHACGKSRWIQKLEAHAPAVWTGKPAISLRALDPLQQWIDQPGPAAWHDKLPSEKRSDPRAWDKLPQHVRVLVVLAWVQEHRAVVLLDDAHRLTGRKAEIATRLVRAAGLVVHTASEETRIALSLRMALAERGPQVVRLSSEAAYDYTSALTWALCILAAAMGAWPIAAAIGGLKIVGSGRRAAKQS